MKQCAICLDYQQTEPHEKRIPYKPLCKPGEVAGSDIFSINNNTLLHIVHYYSKFRIVKEADGLSADDLIKATKIVYAEFGLPNKIQIK